MEQTRDRLKPMKVYVTAEERAAIETHATACSLTVSAYLRNLGAGYEPKSTLDHQAVLHLSKVNGDFGRLGGLLKLWLSEQPGCGASTVDVRRLLVEIETTQTAIRQMILRL